MSTQPTIASAYTLTPIQTDPARRFGPAFVDTLVLTTGAHAALGGGLAAQLAALALLGRHFRGDWGRCCDGDAALSDLAARDGGSTMGIYDWGGTTLWLIVDAVYDEATWRRAAATVLLPSEY